MEFLAVVFDVSNKGICVFFARKYSDSVTHDIEVTRAIQFATLAENKSVVEIELVEFQFFVGILADGLENLFDDFCVMEEGWSKVELESVSLNDLCSATDLAGALDDSNVDTCLCKKK